MIAILLPIQSFAMGIGISGQCTVWREGMAMPGTSEIPFGTYCKSSTGEDSRQRLFELEQEVNKLQLEKTVLESRIDRLENKINETDSKFNLLSIRFDQFSKTIESGLRNIITLLSKK